MHTTAPPQPHHAEASRGIRAPDKHFLTDVLRSVFVALTGAGGTVRVSTIVHTPHLLRSTRPSSALIPFPRSHRV